MSWSWRNWFGPASPEVKAGVARGAALLDARVPGWWTKINVDKLDMWDSRNCVLGQVFGEYGDGCAVLRLEQWSGVTMVNGFFPSGLPSDGSRELLREWKNAVRFRMRSR